MSENNVELNIEKHDYEKPVIKKMGTASELTMSSTSNTLDSFDNGGVNPDFYS